MKVLLTGATGFTGGHVLQLLLRSGHEVRCLVRATSSRASLPSEVELAEGDLNDQASIERALLGRDALVNIASLGFGHAPALVNATVAAGVRRAIFVGTTAVFTNLNAPSKVVRLAAEETIRQSGLDFTLLRPTMIYGTSGDRNMCRLIRFLQRRPIIPIFGDGKHLQQPVHVEDVAAAVVQSLTSQHAIGNSYNISGATVLSYDDVIDTVCSALGRRVRKLHLPVKPVVGALTCVERLKIRLPIKAEQVLRLNEDKAFDHDAAARDFNYAPRTFAEGVRMELEEMARA